MKRLPRRSIALWVAMVLAAGGAKASSSVESATQAFLDWRARPHTHSYSSKEENSQLHELFTDELLCLLQASDRYREKHSRAAPEDKPPYANGDLFLSSAWEPPQSTEIELVSVRGTDATALVRFVDSYGTSWHDRFRLRLDGGGWRLADIDRLSLFQDGEGKFSVGNPNSPVETFYREMGRSRPAVHWHRREADACKALR